MKTRLLLTFIASLLGAHAQTIESDNHSTTGYAKDVPQESAALVFFFFKFK